MARLRAEGAQAVYGDASQPAILEAEGIHHAGALVLSASGSPDAVIRLARELNPEIRIVTRAGYLREVAALKGLGAHVVVSSEGEVALAMAEGLLRGLGATSDQIDRARDRVRQELATV